MSETDAMTILAHTFGQAEVTPVMLDAKIEAIRAELQITHEQAAAIKTRLLAPSRLTDEQHMADEVAFGTAKRAADRLSDTLRQLEEARPVVVEGEAKRQGEAARQAFRRDVDAVAARSTALAARIQAEYPAAAAALASLFGEAQILRRDIGSLRLRGKEIGKRVDLADPEDFRRMPGHFIGNLDGRLMLPGLMPGDAPIYPAA